MKAIKITSGNQSSLVGSYETIEDESQLPIGDYLVTDFGNEETFEIITNDVLNDLFVIVGELKNGYIQIERK